MQSPKLATVSATLPVSAVQAALFEVSVQALQLLPNGTQLVAAAGSSVALLDLRKGLASVAAAELTGDSVCCCLAEPGRALLGCPSGPGAALEAFADTRALHICVA